MMRSSTVVHLVERLAFKVKKIFSSYGNSPTPKEAQQASFLF